MHEATPLPQRLEDVVVLMRKEWRTTTGETPYLAALEARAIELAGDGPLGSRLNETTPDGGDPEVRRLLIEIREAYRALPSQTDRQLT